MNNGKFKSENLKKDISETELATMADTILKGKDGLMRAYNEIRERATPSTELRRKIDACEAVTKDIMKIVYDVIDGYFDAERERHQLHQLLAHGYAYSIYDGVNVPIKPTYHISPLATSESN